MKYAKVPNFILWYLIKPVSLTTMRKRCMLKNQLTSGNRLLVDVAEFWLYKKRCPLLVCEEFIFSKDIQSWDYSCKILSIIEDLKTSCSGKRSSKISIVFWLSEYAKRGFRNASLFYGLISVFSNPLKAIWGIAYLKYKT